MPMNIQTERLTIAPLEESMAQVLHELSLDEDNRRFVPDEVFETPQMALQVIRELRSAYHQEGPQVYAVLWKETLIGYVQAVPAEDGWEIGYHIGKAYTGQGFASEAVKAFLPVIMQELSAKEMQGICLRDNAASIRVLERCDFQKQFDGMGMYQGEERHICRYLFRM